MADLLELSSRFIDEGVYEGPGSVNRMTGELSEVAPGIAVVEAFSHVVAVEGETGLLVVDTSSEAFGAAVVKALRGWSAAPVDTILYTHGHVDHVGGAAALVGDARERGDREPRIVGHRAIPDRFERYLLTGGYNAVVNQRQFGGGRPGRRVHWPSSFVEPGVVFDRDLDLDVAGLAVSVRHARGETDDHAWGWLPAHRAVVSGDFVTWVFPNAGNPQKVQRYPLEWAGALREMAALGPELLLPAHGLPIAGVDRIRRVLDDVASVLEALVHQTLELMNAGATLDEIVDAVRLPATLLDRPYLRPTYDEPEFVVRNVWRLYGGWYDGNPARLKPAPDAALAAEVARLAGGAGALASRAVDLQAEDPRLAVQLVEWAAQAAPDLAAAHDARAAIYDGMRARELSLMARGIYGAAAQESRDRLREPPQI